MLGSLVAFTVYGWMMRVAPLPLVTTYAYVNPVVAVILGALILGETIDLRTLVAGAVIVFAVAVIVTARGRMPAPRAVPTGGCSSGPTAHPVAEPRVRRDRRHDRVADALTTDAVRSRRG